MVNYRAHTAKPCGLFPSPERGFAGGARRLKRRANVSEGGQIVGLVPNMSAFIC